MSQEPEVTPVEHGAMSTVGGTAAGAVGGGLRTGLKTLAITAIIGAALGMILFTGGFGALGGGAVWTMGKALIGGLIGGALGTGLGFFTGTIGGAIGSVNGGSRAAARIREEKGASNMLNAQLSAFRAQAAAVQQVPPTIYAPSASNNNTFPAQGTAMNAAMPQIQGSSIQSLGTIDNTQLQRA